MTLHRFFTALILSALFLTAQAQEERNLFLSPKIGVSISTLEENFEDTDEYKYRTGWNLGLDARFRSGAFVFHPGVHFNQYGFDLKNDLDGDNIYENKDETTVSALRVPVTAGFFLTGTDGILKLHVRGGATPVWIMSLNEKGDPYEFDKDILNEFSIYLNVSVGVDFAIATLDLSYEWGLSDYFDGFGDNNKQILITAGLVL